MYGKSVFRVASLGSVRFLKHDSTKRLLEFLADMPKANTARIADAQRQRQHISKKGQKYEMHGASTVYLQVLGSGARGVPNTLYLFTDQKRYLFNCGECTQRLAHEHKVKLSRLEHIFITSKTWKNIGGLPGLSLTLQDVGVPKITLHGPDGLDELYNATKRFVIMKDMEVTKARCSPSEDFEDSTMTVKYVLIAPSVSLLPKDPRPSKRPRYGEIDKDLIEFSNDDTDYYGRDIKDTKTVKKNKSVPKPSADSHKLKTEKVLLDLQMKNQCSVSYICTLKKRLGTLDLAKCVERGVKPGPVLGQLKAGQDVVLPDGRLVLASDVKSPDDPGPVFIVLDVPEISYLKPDDFAAHFQGTSTPPENVPSLIVHMTPPHVYHEPAYQSFMALFGPTCRHLVLNSQNSCMGSEAVHRTQHKLHLLDPDIFPLLKDISVPAEWNTKAAMPKSNSPIRLKGFEDLKNRIAIAQFQNIINMESSRGDGTPPSDAPEAPKLETHSARTLTTFHLRPKKHLDRTAEPKLHVHEYYQETMDVDGFVSSLESFRQLVDSTRFAQTAPAKEFPKLVFLGTGSCIPSKTRNTSGIVLHINENSTMLLDCGEGTFGQMVRFYGPRKVDDVLRTIKAIYISHLHADHHIGLIGVLQARAAALRQDSAKASPAFLLAPGQIVSWLAVYDQHFERIAAEFTLVPNQNLMDETNRELTSANLARTGLEAVVTCAVPHCPNAFGVALTVAGHKLTYSGDTLPTDNLVRIGENSTILIHEATMEDELENEARVKMHSTTSQAIEIGRKMGARYTVLTHFSQRYARLPRLNSQILHDNNTVGIAFDNMQITLNDLELLPHMYAPLQLMFAEHCVEMELKAAHRERRRDRRSSSPNIPGKPQETNAGRRNTYPRLVSARASCPKPSKPLPPPASKPCPSVHDTRENVVRTPSTPLRHETTSLKSNHVRAHYRESHASRLRQLSRGMPSSGAIGPPRAKSSSPTKRHVLTPPEDCTLRQDATPQSSPDKFGVDLIHSAQATPSNASSVNKDAHDCLRIVTTPPTGRDKDSRPKSTTSSSSINSNGEARKNSGILSAPHARPKSTTSSSSTINSNGAVRKNSGIDTAPHGNKKIAQTCKMETVKSPTRQCRDNAASPPKTMGVSCTRMKPREQNSAQKPFTTKTKYNHPKSPARPGLDADLNIEMESSNQKSKVNTRSPGVAALSKCNSKEIPSIASSSKRIMKESSIMPEKECTVLRSCSKDIKQVPFCSKPNVSYQGSKGFKPRLEDIKSSFLLLNNIKTGLQGKEFVRVQKPDPFSESKRKAILLESKTKFQSKHFRNESTLLYTMLNNPADFGV